MQSRLGVREKLETSGRRFIRNHIPEQHRAFYSGLRFLLIGTIDAAGQPWASIVAGPPGFVSSPDPSCLHVAGQPLPGDPLAANLSVGADIAVLGIDLETRQRNRVTGTVMSLAPDGFEIMVRQAFGNCPQYIQTRAVRSEPGERIGPAPAGATLDRLDAAAQAQIGRADTFFIATAFADGSGDRTTGADVSHRGGKPGFVYVEDDRTLVFPDYVGNFYFNTIGNILLNPAAGLLFVDFDSGDLLYLTSSADVIWDGAAVRAFAGAERLLRLHVSKVIRIAAGLPLRFHFQEYSPSLEATGSWQQAEEKLAADRERDAWIDHEVFRIEPESETITSFYLRRADGRAVAGHRPGQFLPIRINVPGHAEPLVRTYTVSDAPRGNHYRLSVKREEGGLVSQFLHDVVVPGFHVEAMAARGRFTLEDASDRPVVLVSGGVGITPMLAMVNHLIEEGRRTRNFLRIFFIHATPNGQTLAFGPHLRALARVHASLVVHIRFSRPHSEDRLGETHDSVGRVDIDLLKGVLPFDDHEFYLCGPEGFMRTLYEGLIGLSVRPERVHYESFGSAALLEHGQHPRPQMPVHSRADGAVVRFAASQREARWSPEDGTLLEFAQSIGLSPCFGCRTGVCGSCTTRLTGGSVDYILDPVAPHGAGHVLICCSTPRSASGTAARGAAPDVVLDL